MGLVEIVGAVQDETLCSVQAVANRVVMHCEGGRIVQLGDVEQTVSVELDSVGEEQPKAVEMIGNEDIEAVGTAIVGALATLPLYIQPPVLVETLSTAWVALVTTGETCCTEQVGTALETSCTIQVDTLGITGEETLG